MPTTPPESCALCGGENALWCGGCGHYVCEACDLDGLLGYGYTFRHRVEDHQEDWWSPGDEG
jgi:hypothetical protein